MTLKAGMRKKKKQAKWGQKASSAGCRHGVPSRTILLPFVSKSIPESVSEIGHKFLLQNDNYTSVNYALRLAFSRLCNRTQGKAFYETNSRSDTVLYMYR